MQTIPYFTRPWPLMPGQRCWATQYKSELPEGLHDREALVIVEATEEVIIARRAAGGPQFEIARKFVELPLAWIIDGHEYQESHPMAQRETRREIRRMRYDSPMAPWVTKSIIATLDWVLERSTPVRAMAA